MTVNGELKERAVELYQKGYSIPECAKHTGLSRSTVRARLVEIGILRSRTEGVRLAAKKGLLGSGCRGKTRKFTDAHKKAIKKARIEWGKNNAKGTRVNPRGYIEFTTGEHKGRTVHVVKMENRIGRRLLPDEVVHHIDGCKTNNNLNNLALCTSSGHARLHRREDSLAGINRERNKNGTWR